LRMPSSSSARKARSASPAPNSTKKKEGSSKASSAPKTPQPKSATPASGKKRNTKKSEAKSPKESEQMIEYFDKFVQEMDADTSALHNVLRVQYVQCYAMALMNLASSFSPAVKPLPMLAGSSNLTQAVMGSLGLAQAFSLTAAAQTTYSGMKKALQYNMMFHLIFAFVVIVHQDPKIELNIPAVVAMSCVNVGLNMWACYFRESNVEVEEDEK